MNMYQNDKREIAMEEYSVKNNWRFGREWPPMIGDKGDGFSLVLLFISIPVMAILGLKVLYVVLSVILVRNLAKFKNVTVLELFYSLFKWIAPEKSGCSSFRQKNLLGFAALAFMVTGTVSQDAHAIEIIRALPKEVVQIQKPHLGEFFIENINHVEGHGTATLDKLLTVLVKEPHDYKIIYTDTELAQMVITWRSLPPRSLTVDQILGSLSVRYGIYFYTPRGASEVYVAWLRDENECRTKNDGVFIALCGVDLGRY